jgi:hypothetical protein
MIAFFIDHGLEFVLAVYAAWRHVTTPKRHAEYSSRMLRGER